MTVRTTPTRKEDAAVVSAAASAVRHVQRLGIPYAGIMAPLHDDGLEDAMRRLTILAAGRPIGRDILEAISPPVFGRYLMLWSTDVAPPQRRLAKRHGMGHVACGHVTEVSYLSSRDFMTHEERSADLFALADLVPWSDLDELRGLRLGWRAIRQDVCQRIRYYTVDWPEARVLDRADLRIALYREHGL